MLNMIGGRQEHINVYTILKNESSRLLENSAPLCPYTMIFVSKGHKVNLGTHNIQSFPYHLLMYILCILCAPLCPLEKERVRSTLSDICVPLNTSLLKVAI